MNRLAVLARWLSLCLFLVATFVSIGWAQDKAAPEGAKEAAKITAEPDALTFDTTAGCCGDKTLKLTADPAATKALKIKAGSQLKVEPDTCKITADAKSCSVVVSYTGSSGEQTTGEISVSDDAGNSIVVKASGKGACCREAKWTTWVLPITAFCYLLAFFILRWHLIAKPTRALLDAQVASVRSRVRALGSSAAQLESLLDLAKLPDGSLPQTLVWSNGKEIAGWGYVHEVEARLASMLPAAQVQAALEQAEPELRLLNDPPATALADRIKGELDSVSKLVPAFWTLTAELENMAAARGQDFDTRMASATPAMPVEDLIRLAAPVNAALKFKVRLADQLRSLAESEVATRDPGLKAFLKATSDSLTATPAKVTADLDAALSKSPPEAKALFDALSAARPHIGPHLEESARKVVDRLEAHQDVRLARLRALLSSALGLIYDARDNSFAILMTWHNKAAWLIVVSLVLIIALGATLGNAVLLLLGAVGGCLSRMTRALTATDVPTDYGASWTTLFLSPLMGALAAWTGILLVVLGAKLQIIGAAIDVSWCCPTAPTTMAIAVMLGLSERLLDRLLSGAESRIAPPSKPAMPPAPAPVDTTSSATVPPKDKVK
jgi:hypothetical protein